MMREPPTDAVLTQLKAAAGPGGWTDAADVLAPRLVDWRGRKHGRSPLLLRPDSVAALQAIVRIAAEYGVGLVPQGGNTGMVGGSVPEADGASVLVGLDRMARIRAIDAEGAALTAEAGVVLQAVHDAAARMGCVFPLSLASKGSATIGGLISTNAGGVQVLRHGTMRAQVLGIEAVLPDGSLLDQLSPLPKDNSGYDIKQLLIGAEGTLGFVTAATLRLIPAPAGTATAWVGVPDPAAALALLARLRAASGNQVESFEFMPQAGIDLLRAHIDGVRAPLSGDSPWQLLVELAGSPDSAGLRAVLEHALAAALQAGEVSDAVIAASATQATALWQLRENLPEAERRDGMAVKHDIAVPVARLPDFLSTTTPAVERGWPGVHVLAFGHLGDGNVHYNVRAPKGADARAFVETEGPAITRFINDRVMAHGGTISAEHGIGTFKRDELARLGDPGKLQAMRAIKAALDPKGIMNPGKLL